MKWDYDNVVGNSAVYEGMILTMMSGKRLSVTKI